MPLGPGRYRVKTTKSGAKIRLHFTPSGKVDEAKRLAKSVRRTLKKRKAPARRSAGG